MNVDKYREFMLARIRKGTPAGPGCTNAALFGRATQKRFGAGEIEEIAYAVADLYGIPAAELRGRARTKTIAEARLCVILVARRCTRLSSTEIGDALDRDHTTVLSSVKSAERLSARDKYFAAVVAELCERFGENLETSTQ
jgi:chromosomal replication initiation ATPase DnaA